jgi:hypothetical protein
VPTYPTPNWLTQPKLGWLPCTFKGEYDPEGYAVQIHINGETVSAIVPYDALDQKKEKVKIAIVAELEEPGTFLAELPAAPFVGTQRVVVKKDWLRD